MKTPFTLLASLLFCAITSAQTPYWEWMRGGGDTVADAANDVAHDVAGNVYAAGYFGGETLIVGQDTLLNPIAANGFLPNVLLVKYSITGNVLWAKGGGGNYADAAHSVAVDGFGDVYVSGNYSVDALVFDDDTLPNLNGNLDVFVAKFDANGNALWLRGGGGTGIDGMITSVVTDGSGNCIVAGTFLGPTIVFGAFTLTNANSTGSFADIFIVKYDSFGNVIWAQSAGGALDDEVHDLVADATGSFTITGSYKSTTLSFGAYTLNNTVPGNADILVAKFNSSGVAQWAQSAGGSGNDVGEGITQNAFGEICISGYFNSPVSVFNSLVLSNAGGEDIFVAKYASGGQIMWAESFGSAANERSNAISCDGGSNLLITGIFSGTIIFGPDVLVNSGMHGDLYVAEVDSAGVASRGIQATGSGLDQGFGIDSDPNGTVYVGGQFRSIYLVCGNDTVHNDDVNGKDDDFFVAKIGKQTGVEEWSATPRVNVFPNPSSDIFNFSVTAAAQLTVYNAEGSLVMQQQLLSGNNEVNLSAYGTGMYFFRVEHKDGSVASGKLIAE